MTTDYSRWLGKRVVIHIVSGNSDVDLRCMMVHEYDGRVRVRIGEGWDVDIYKEMIDSVEAEGGFAHTPIVSLLEI